ncbi:MAG: hypothetical protein QOF61_1926, partial [Acidobacteriota bacterium]|nr:hypothetical protein [Acidobacteriota bacterium]
GIIGFIVGKPADPMTPNFIGTHLTFSHNIVHVLTGAISLYFGLAGTLSGARMFCIVFGVIYALLGVCGFLLGSGADRMLEIAGLLHLGTMDHVVHILLGVLYLIGGLMTKAAVAASRDA